MCKFENCGKMYASETSLRQHQRIKGHRLIPESKKDQNQSTNDHIQDLFHQNDNQIDYQQYTYDQNNMQMN